MPTLLAEFYKLVLTCIATMRVSDPGLFIGAILGGLTIGGLLWWAAHLWAHSWNRKFSLSPIHQVLAAFVLILSTVFSLAAVSLKYADRVVENKVRLWQQLASADEGLKQELSGRLYDEIAMRGAEDMSKIPDPRTLGPGEVWMFTYQNAAETQAIIGDVYTRGALRHFQRANPLLGTILSPAVSPDVVIRDIQVKSQANPGEPYNLGDAVRLLVEQMFLNMRDQLWRIVVIARTVAAVLFVLFLAIPFSMIAVSAYKDIHVHTLPNRLKL